MAVATAVDVEVGAVADRDRRAAEEYLTTVEFAPGLYHVYSEVGTEYTIGPGLRFGACDCPDSVHRNVKCKHIRRVEMEIGVRPIPPGVNVDSNLLRALEGEH